MCDNIENVPTSVNISLSLIVAGLFTFNHRGTLTLYFTLFYNISIYVSSNV